MSEYLFLYRNSTAAREAAMGTPEQRQKNMQRWMAWMRDLEGKGHLKNAGQPLDRPGKLVRGGSKAVTDGPFVEAKDVIGGYSIIEARDLAHAAELAKGCPALDGADGSVEVRPVLKLEM
jgi:hypothetical protein